MTLCTSLMRRTSCLMFIWVVVLLFTMKLLKDWTNQPRMEKSCQILRKIRCISGNEQHKFSIDKENLSCIFLSRYKLWDMDREALMSFNHTTDRDSTSNQYPQTTTHQTKADSYPVFSSLWSKNGTWMTLYVNCAVFLRNISPDGRVNGTIAKVEELSDPWQPGTMYKVPPFVMNSSWIQEQLHVLVAWFLSFVSAVFVVF